MLVPEIIPAPLAVIWTAATSNAAMQNVNVFFVVILQYLPRWWFLRYAKQIKRFP